MATEAVAVRDVEVSILDNLNGLLCLGGLGGFGFDASDGESDDEIVIEDGSLVRFEGQTWTATQNDDGGYWLFPGAGADGGAVVVEDARELKVPGPTRGATCPICMDDDPTQEWRAARCGHFFHARPGVEK